MSRPAPANLSHAWNVRSNRICACSTFALAGFALSACAPPTINVESQWEESIRNLNMFAIYPIDEDVQVGDVFLYAPASGNSTSTRFRLTRIDSVDPRGCLVEALRHQQSKRLRVEPRPNDQKPSANHLVQTASDERCQQEASATTQEPKSYTPQRSLEAKTAKIGAKGAPAIPSAIDVGNVLNIDAPIHLRRAALPGFTVASITQGQLAGGAFFGPVAAALGLSASSDTAITLTLHDIEELSLDAAPAQLLEESQAHRFLSETVTPERLLDYIRAAREDLVVAFCDGNFQRLHDEQLGFIIANRVMYAHGIEYGYRTSSQFGATALAEVAATHAAAVAAGLPAASPGTPAPAAALTPGGKVLSADDAAAAVAQGLAANQASIAAILPKMPGATVHFGMGRLGVASLTFTYDQPLAVGVGAPITHSIGELMRMHAHIIEGTFPREKHDKNGNPTLQYIQIHQQYLDIREPLKQSLKNTMERCAEITGHNSPNLGEALNGLLGPQTGNASAPLRTTRTPLPTL